MSEEHLGALPPPRDELPTLPVDLREYARESVRPGALLPDLIDDAPEEITAEFAIDTYLRERQKHVPRLLVAPSQLPDVLLDHREGFITSLVDGVSSVEMLMDIAGMPKAEALAVLCNLHARGVITFD